MNKIKISLITLLSMLSTFKITGWLNEKTTLLTFCICSLIMLLVPFKEEESKHRDDELLLTNVVKIIYIIFTLTMIMVNH